MAIQVTTNYRGRRTQEQLIAPGIYFREDPALFGLADFLVETGRAIEIKGGPQVPEEEVSAPSTWEISEPPDPDEQLVSYGPETLMAEDGLDGAETIVDAPDDPLPFTELVESDDEDTAEVEVPPTPKTGKAKRG